MTGRMDGTGGTRGETTEAETEVPAETEAALQTDRTPRRRARYPRRAREESTTGTRTSAHELGGGTTPPTTGTRGTRSAGTTKRHREGDRRRREETRRANRGDNARTSTCSTRRRFLPLLPCRRRRCGETRLETRRKTTTITQTTRAGSWNPSTKPGAAGNGKETEVAVREGKTTQGTTISARRGSARRRMTGNCKY